MIKKPSLLQAILPIVILLILLTLNVFIFEDTLDGPNQLALILAAAVGVTIAYKIGYRWEAINHRIVKTIGSAMPSMLILLLIGSLAGTWLISGVVPAMIYYGLDLINPKIFLVTAVVVSGIVSVVTGSSWSTIATIGIALLGIGKALGFNEAMVAGAIISGAYFGDKISPLSDTTNLAPAMAGTDLFTHIRYMLYTTIPSMLITLIIFLFIGIFYDNNAANIDINLAKETIANTFNINPFLMLVPIILFAVIILKVPPLPSLLIGTLAGAIFAVIFQPEIIYQVAGEGFGFAKSSYIATMQAMFGDVSLTTDNASINDLLSTSGMKGMLNTVWLILSAMVFGGVMEGGGMLERITRPIAERAKSNGALVAATAGTSLFFNFTASDQYISIVVPGRMFKDTFAKKGLKPEVLSRTLEDSGTMTSVLIPWNTCGATQSKVLGVATLAYLPFCFFNIISPIMTILYAYLNIKIRKIEPTAESTKEE